MSMSDKREVFQSEMERVFRQRLQEVQDQRAQAFENFSKESYFTQRIKNANRWQGLTTQTVLHWRNFLSNPPKNPGWILIADFSNGQLTRIQNAIYSPIDNVLEVIDDNAVIEMNEHGRLSQIKLTVSQKRQHPTLVWANPSPAD